MKETSLFDSLLEEPQKPSGPVTCLGMAFENDEARCAHFTEELRKKLQDPEFRKIEGFPIGSDEDILNLSDPPYYTACPNPWIADFIAEWEAQKPEQPEGYHYHREPFAADVSEGKNDPIYNAHSYHTKVPHKAIMRYILHYTQPGDIVFDGFCGTGMTGVAAQMCGDREVVMSLGYQVKPDGTILREETDEDGNVIKEILGVSKIFDPVLLEEIIQYNDQGNFDRIIAAELAIAQALRMDPILGKVGGSGDERLKSFFKPNKKNQLFTESRGLFPKKKSKLFI